MLILKSGPKLRQLFISGTIYQQCSNLQPEPGIIMPHTQIEYVKTDHIANTSNNITDRHNHTEIVWLRVYLPLILTKMMKWRIYKLSISVFVGIKSPGDTKFGQDCSRQVCQKKLSSSLSDSEGQNAFEFFLLSNSKSTFIRCNICRLQIPRHNIFIAMFLPLCLSCYSQGPLARLSLNTICLFCTFGWKSIW